MLDPQLTPLPGSNLTPREREVVMALATGASNREIGQALYVTETTVKQHVSQAMRKLGARNRTQLAVMYLVATHDSNGVSPLSVLPAPAGGRAGDAVMARWNSVVAVPGRSREVGFVGGH